MGFRSGILLGDDLSDAMRVFNNIFGGTCTSRLFTVIREKMGLCYYCDSDYISTKGLLFVCSGIDSDNRDTAEKGILEQLEILKNIPVGEDELKSAKDMAIKELSERIQLIDENKYPVQEYREALVMAVQALKGFDIEQIRAEIEQSRYGLVNDGLDLALKIIDKYMK